MNKLNRRAARSAVFGALVLAGLIFGPAETLAYWQGWAFLATFAICTGLITVDLAVHNPALLERRMNAGPAAEKEPRQKLIMVLAMLAFVASVVVPSLDHRQRWSPASPLASVVGNMLVALGFLAVYRVLKENAFGASTIQIAEHQTVISTGPYAIVRHPMYAGAFPLIIGVPLALGSLWGVAPALALVPILIWRLREEEKFLHVNLPGYTAYTQRVRWRLIPGLY